jgi:hypothetical protein
MFKGNARTMARAACGLMAGAALMAALGCRVEQHKNGNNDDVQIAMPFGAMSVKTNDNVAQQGVGLAVYPGATLQSKEKGKDSGAADVNFSFGSFHLGVKALSYRTPDAPDKVLSFYRKDMARYGAVILCRNNMPIGQPDHTQEGLSCDGDGKTRIHAGEDAKNDDELKAGSKQHQHIVAVSPDGSGTKIGLVALDLPGHIGADSDDKQ